MTLTPHPDLEIPAAFRREPSKPTRELSLTVEQRREAHRIAASCAKLLEQDRKRRARQRKRRTAK